MKAIIAAIDEESGIGKDGKIPWYFPEDFKWFKEQTKDSVVIMGYNTFAELAEKFKFTTTGKLLPGRISYVISKRDIQSTETVKASFQSLHAAIKDAEEKYPDRNIFLIGGTQIFVEGLPLVDTVFLTRVPGIYNCDTFFPIWRMATAGYSEPICEASSTTPEGKELKFLIYKSE